MAKASGAEVNPLKLQAIFDSMPPSMRSSMQKDLAAKRQLELDAIAGPIMRGGERYGIDVSITAGLVAAIRSADCRASLLKALPSPTLWPTAESTAYNKISNR